MDELLQHPAVQAGLAPLLVGAVMAAALWRTRFAWFALVAAYATAIALSTGLTLQPLTAGRKVTLAVLLAPFIGTVLDGLPNPPRWLPAGAAAVGGVLTWWVFASVLGQREWGERALLGLGLGALVAAQVALTVRLRDDGVVASAAGVTGALAVGIAGLLSASIGYFVSGVSLAAGAGALLALQFLLRRQQTAGYTGTLPLGLGVALFAAGSALLAQLPWYTLPLLALIPLAARQRATAEGTVHRRATVATGLATAAALLFLAAVWLAVRASATAAT